MLQHYKDLKRKRLEICIASFGILHSVLTLMDGEWFWIVQYCELSSVLNDTPHDFGDNDNACNVGEIELVVFLIYLYSFVRLLQYTNLKCTLLFSCGIFINSIPPVPNVHMLPLSREDIHKRHSHLHSSMMLAVRSRTRPSNVERHVFQCFQFQMVDWML